MALSTDADANVAQVMHWLGSDDAPQDAVSLREELAYLLFHGDPSWANNDGSIGAYRGILSTWLDGDPSAEATFLQLTAPGAAEADARQMFVTWFTPVVNTWKGWAKTNEGAAAEGGIPNPGYAADQTPGTQYYRYDAGNEVYLYSSTPDAPGNDWLSYEDRRYTPVAYDGERKTNYRQDVVTGEYEFQSKVQAKWLTATQWDEEVSAGGGAENRAAAEEATYTPPVYDAGFQMYRRFNSVRGEYEYADDVDAEAWLSLTEASARITGARAPADQEQAAEPSAQQQAAVQAVYDQIVVPALERLEQSGDPAVVSILSQPGGRDRLEAEIRRAASQILAAAPSS
jgi:hypothetical protein